MAVTFRVEHFDFATVEVNPLNIPTGIAVGQPLRRMPVGGHFQPPIITNIDLTVRPNGGTVRATASFGHHFFLAIHKHPRQRPAGDLDDQHAAIIQSYRAFRELESRGDFTYLRHLFLLHERWPFFWIPAFAGRTSRLFPAQNLTL